MGVNAQSAAGIATRAEEDALAKRYQDAATQLGHKKAAVRLAGVYAMARLADDWPGERQTCVDVLCAYMRMPWPSNEADEVAERQVRKSLVRLLNAHLTYPGRARDPVWSDLDFDFSDADFRYLNLASVYFKGRVTFEGARFGSSCSLRFVDYGLHSKLRGCSVYGELFIEGVEQEEHHKPVYMPELTIEPTGSMNLLTVDSSGSGSLVIRGCDVYGRLGLHVGAESREIGIQVINLTAHDGGSVFLVEDRFLECEAHEFPYVTMENWVIRSGAELRAEAKVWGSPNVTSVDLTVEAGATVDFDAKLDHEPLDILDILN